MSCDYCKAGTDLPLPDPRRDRVDLRPPHRRHAGRVRTRSLRRQRLDSAARGSERGAGCDASDILPDRLRDRRAQRRVKEGDVVAVIGAGPVGLAAIMTAAAGAPARSSRSTATSSGSSSPSAFGATDTIDINDGRRRRPDAEGAEPDGLGVDVAIEAVGIPATFSDRARLDPARRPRRQRRSPRRAGQLPDRARLDQQHHHHDRPRQRHDRPELLEKISSGAIDPGKFVTHRFTSTRSSRRTTPSRTRPTTEPSRCS